MKLFKLNSGTVEIDELAYTLKPFKVIWDRDKSKIKEKATLELAYIFFMADPRSDYMIYIDEDTRISEIKKGLGLKDNWKPDDKVTEALNFYKGFKSESALLLEDTRVAISKLREYIKTIDLNAVDNNGKPIYTLNTFTATIGQIPKLITLLDEAEKTLAKEIVQSDKVRGASEKAPFEDF